MNYGLVVCDQIQQTLITSARGQNNQSCTTTATASTFRSVTTATKGETCLRAEVPPAVSSRWDKGIRPSQN